MTINPNNPNINVASVVTKSDDGDSNTSTNLLKNKKQQDIDRKLDQRRADDRNTSTTVKAEVTQEATRGDKATFQDTIKSSAQLNKIASKNPVNSNAPQLQSPQAIKKDTTTMGSLDSFIESSLKMTPDEKKFQNMSQALKVLKNGLTDESTEALANKLGMSGQDVKSLLEDVQSRLTENAKSDAAETQSSNFGGLIAGKSPEEQKTLRFLYANPEFKGAMPEGVQAEFSELMEKTQQMTKEQFPEMEEISRGSDKFNSQTSDSLELAFMKLSGEAGFSEGDQNTLGALFSRPEIAEKDSKAKELLQPRNELLSKAMKETMKERSGVDISDEDLASVMRDASKFNRDFEKNLKSMNLDKKTEDEVMDLLTDPYKEVGIEAEQAFKDVTKQTLKDDAFKNNQSGFSKNTLVEAEGFKNSMEKGVDDLAGSSQTKKQLFELIQNPEKFQSNSSSAEVIKVFNQLIVDKGFLGVGEAHTKFSVEGRKFGDSQSLIAKLQKNLRKSGATPEQADKFIEKLLNGEVSMNHPIVRKSLGESLFERGLPEDYEFEISDLKKVFEASKTEIGERAVNTAKFANEALEAIKELNAELNSEPSQSPSFNVEVSTAGFVRLIGEVSTKMMAVNQYISYTNTNLSTQIQNAMRESSNSMLQSQAQASHAETILGKVGQGMEYAVTFALMLLTNPIGTLNQIYQGGGVGRGGVTSAIEGSAMYALVDTTYEKVIQPIMEIVGKIINALKNVIKLVIIAVLGPIVTVGFMSNVSEEGFKNALNESLLTSFNAGLEAMGVPMDSTLAVAADTVFTIVTDAVAVVSIAVAALVLTVVTGGAGMIAILGMAISMAAMLIGKSLMDLMGAWEESGAISSDQEKKLKIAIGVITLTTALLGMIIGLGAGIGKMAGAGTTKLVKLDEAMNRPFKMVKTQISGMFAAAADMSKNPMEFVKNLSAVGKELSESASKGMSVGDFYLSKKASKVSANIDEVLEAAENLSEAQQADLKSSFDAFKVFQEQLLTDRENGSFTSKAIYESRMASNEVQKSIDTVLKYSSDNKLKDLNKKTKKLDKDLRALDSIMENQAAESRKAGARVDSSADDSGASSDEVSPDDDTGAPVEGGVPPTTGTAPASVDPGLIAAQEAATEAGLKKTVDNTKSMMKKFIDRIKNIGEKEAAEQMTIDEYIPPNVQKKMRQRKWATGIQSGAHTVMTLGRITSGSVKMYQGVLQALTAIPQRKIQQSNTMMEYYQDNIDLDQTVINNLFQDTKEALEGVQGSYQFFLSVLAQLSSAASSAASSLSKH